MKLFVLSKENLALARAEAERLHDSTGTLYDNILLLDVAVYSQNLAFTREIHDLLFISKNNDLKTMAENYGWAAVEPPFLVRSHCSPIPEEELAGFVWRGLERAGKTPSVSLTKPSTTVSFFFAEGEWFVGIKRWVNEEKFFDRRAHLRPANHPTSLSPKLARGIVNLAGREDAVLSILDPFCGSGGILLEGALAGRQMTGTDIDQIQIRRAEENLAAYGVAATLSVMDAATCDSLGLVDAIVTDLPYGHNSLLHDKEKTFSTFFGAAARITSRLVVACDTECDLPHHFSAQWREVSSFSWYLHKSLSKRIFVLEKL